MCKLSILNLLLDYNLSCLEFVGIFIDTNTLLLSVIMLALLLIVIGKYNNYNKQRVYA